MKDCTCPAFDDAMDVRTQGIIDSPPTDDAAFRQKAWDAQHVKVHFNLLISADDDRARARSKLLLRRI